MLLFSFYIEFTCFCQKLSNVFTHRKPCGCWFSRTHIQYMKLLIVESYRPWSQYLSYWPGIKKIKTTSMFICHIFILSNGLNWSGWLLTANHKPQNPETKTIKTSRIICNRPVSLYNVFRTEYSNSTVSIVSFAMSIARGPENSTHCKKWVCFHLKLGIKGQNQGSCSCYHVFLYCLMPSQLSVNNPKVRTILHFGPLVWGS